MGIAYDAGSLSAKAAGSGGNNSQSHSHTCTGNDRFLLAWVHTAEDVGEAGAFTMTYAGAAMTQIVNLAMGTYHLACFYKVNPASGANTLAASWAGGTNYGTLIGNSFTGVHQTDPIGTYGSANALSVAVTSEGGQLVADVVANRNAGSLTVGAGQTERVSQATTERIANSTEAGAASVTMSWTTGTTNTPGIVAVPIKPAVSGGFFPFFSVMDRVKDMLAGLVRPRRSAVGVQI